MTIKLLHIFLNTQFLKSNVTLTSKILMYLRKKGRFNILINLKNENNLEELSNQLEALNNTYSKIYHMVIKVNNLFELLTKCPSKF